MADAPAQDKLNWCREQIEMRVVGLSWTDWSTPWGSSKDDKDENVGTLPQLVAHLKEVLTEEKSLRARGELPSQERALQSADLLAQECPAAQFKRKTFKALGTPTAQADELAPTTESIFRLLMCWLQRESGARSWRLRARSTG